MKSRKLQQVGGGTYTVSIPKEWADEHALEAGMDLHLYTHADGSIIVRTAERDGDGLASAEVAVTGDGPELVERALARAAATDRVLDSIRRTADCGAVVARIALQSAVRAERD